MVCRFTVCTGCRGGAELAAALRETPWAEVAEADCLSVCTDPATLAAQAPGRATYVFSGLGAADRDDIGSFLTAYLEAPAGWIEDARPLGRLRFRLVARVPAP